MNTDQNYRKVTEQELTMLGFKLPDRSLYAEHRSFVKKYYPSTAHVIQVVFDSEYNDCTYTTSFRYIIVYDRDGNELAPLKETAQECRNKWSIFDDIMPYETDNPIDPINIMLSEDVPDLYIKITP